MDVANVDVALKVEGSSAAQFADLDAMMRRVFAERHSSPSRERVSNSLGLSSQSVFITPARSDAVHAELPPPSNLLQHVSSPPPKAPTEFPSLTFPHMTVNPLFQSPSPSTFSTPNPDRVTVPILGHLPHNPDQKFPNALRVNSTTLPDPVPESDHPSETETAAETESTGDSNTMVQTPLAIAAIAMQQSNTAPVISEEELTLLSSHQIPDTVPELQSLVARLKSDRLRLVAELASASAAATTTSVPRAEDLSAPPAERSQRLDSELSQVKQDYYDLVAKATAFQTENDRLHEQLRETRRELAKTQEVFQSQIAINSELEQAESLNKILSVQLRDQAAQLQQAAVRLRHSYSGGRVQSDLEMIGGTLATFISQTISKTQFALDVLNGKIKALAAQVKRLTSHQGSSVKVTTITTASAQRDIHLEQSLSYLHTLLVKVVEHVGAKSEFLAGGERSMSSTQAVHEVVELVSVLRASHDNLAKQLKQNEAERERLTEAMKTTRSHSVSPPSGKEAASQERVHLLEEIERLEKDLSQSRNWISQADQDHQQLGDKLRYTQSLLHNAEEEISHLHEQLKFCELNRDQATKELRLALATSEQTQKLLVFQEAMRANAERTKSLFESSLIQLQQSQSSLSHLAPHSVQAPVNQLPMTQFAPVSAPVVPPVNRAEQPHLYSLTRPLSPSVAPIQRSSSPSQRTTSPHRGPITQQPLDSPLTVAALQSVAPASQPAQPLQQPLSQRQYRAPTPTDLTPTMTTITTATKGNDTIVTVKNPLAGVWQPSVSLPSLTVGGSGPKEQKQVPHHFTPAKQPTAPVTRVIPESTAPIPLGHAVGQQQHQAHFHPSLHSHPATFVASESVSKHTPVQPRLPERQIRVPRPELMNASLPVTPASETVRGTYHEGGSHPQPRAKSPSRVVTFSTEYGPKSLETVSRNVTSSVDSRYVSRRPTAVRSIDVGPSMADTKLPLLNSPPSRQPQHPQFNTQPPVTESSSMLPMRIAPPMVISDLSRSLSETHKQQEEPLSSSSSSIALRNSLVEDIVQQRQQRSKVKNLVDSIDSISFASHLQQSRKAIEADMEIKEETQRIQAEARAEFLETLHTIESDVRPSTPSSSRGAPDLTTFSFDEAYKYYVSLSRLQNSLWGTLNKLGHEMKALTPDGKKTRFVLELIGEECLRAFAVMKSAQVPEKP